MSEINLQNKALHATKWSTLTQLAAKLVAPVTNMILARLLAPEAFGVVATVTMITTFAELFTDAGFQKYLVQREFKDEDEKHKNANVAFYTNFVISLLLWGLIIIFSEQLAKLVGSPELGIVVAVSCIQLPLTAFSSIQMALYRRDFDFKTLFMVRMVSIAIPFAVTIPLALIGLSYWALVIGNIAMHILNAVILTVKSKWRPSKYFSFTKLKQMLSFSLWSLAESVSIWLTTWVDAFIISSVLTEYYLGVYKTSTTMVNALMSIVTASIVPVLFSTLSRLQNDSEKFNRTYFNVQRLVSIFVFPLGIGVFLYSDLATTILLGDQWSEASPVIGIWALTSAIMIVLGHFSSEAYRAKGRPKLSFLSQMLHLAVLVPACFMSSRYGFWPLVYTRSLIRMQGLLVHFIILKVAIGIPFLKMIKNVSVPAITAVLMGGVGYLLQQVYDSLIWDFISIGICVVFYFGFLVLFPSFRKDVQGTFGKFFNRTKKLSISGVSKSVE